jgi:hypothetical protein
MNQPFLVVRDEWSFASDPDLRKKGLCSVLSAAVVFAALSINKGAINVGRNGSGQLRYRVESLLHAENTTVLQPRPIPK